MHLYKTYFVYIVTNKPRGVFYTGVSNNLERRVVEHRLGTDSSFTKKYKLHRLVWFETHNDISEAILREKRIKRWRRQWKIELIEAMNAEWKDLGGRAGGLRSSRG